MAFDLNPRGGGAMVSMNLVPLIDVMLVLLILFIVTIPVQTHAVKLDMPGPPPLTSVQAETVDLEIDFDGTVIWNGSVVPNRATLTRFFESVAAQADQPDVRLWANRLARYEAVARVLSDAQRSGVQRIGFAGTGEYAQ